MDFGGGSEGDGETVTESDVTSGNSVSVIIAMGLSLGLILLIGALISAAVVYYGCYRKTVQSSEALTSSEPKIRQRG